MSDSPALDAAIRMLGVRDYFARELGTRLRSKGFTAAEAEQAVATCAERGLIDDGKIAARFVEARAAGRGWGRRRLVGELLRRGVEPALAEAAARLPGTGETGLETALRRLERHAAPGWWKLPRARSRMVSSLIGRGFDARDAIRAVEELATEKAQLDEEPPSDQAE